jgi:hypothetical protein
MPNVPASYASRNKQPGRLSRVAAIGHSSSADRVLAAVGVMTALSSLAFAGYMVADADRPPRIAGLEYLSIFARPGHAGLGAGDPPARAETPNVAARSVDPTPTGSIPDKVGASRPVNFIIAPMRSIDPSPSDAASSAFSSYPYKLLDVLNGEALVQTDVGLRHVKAGDLLPDLGRVNAIERRGDHWVLLTQSGAALEWPPKVSSAGDAPAPGKKSAAR